MCRTKGNFFHHRRHGGCRSMKRHGEASHRGWHFDLPPRRCHHRERSPQKENHEQDRCIFMRKNHHSMPHHNFGSAVCEKSVSGRNHGHHEHGRYRPHGPSHRHHHGRHQHGRRHRFIGRRHSTDF